MKSDDVYTTIKTFEGVSVDDSKTARNFQSEKFTIWVQSPFIESIKEGQTVSVTGYFFVIHDFHYQKINDKVVYPLKIGCAAFNICPYINGEIDMAIIEELDGSSTSLFESNLNMNEFLTKQADKTDILFKAKFNNDKKDRQNFICKATQNHTMTSVPLSISNETK